MNFDSSSKFISSLAKFLQSLCNGYVEYDHGVEVIGHISINVDKGKKLDYVLNEQVCKNEENSVTFISNSFHAQPAEKPKPESKPEPEKPSDPGGPPLRGDDDEIMIVGCENERTNTNLELRGEPGQMLTPTSRGAKRGRPSKKSYSQSFNNQQSLQNQSAPQGDISNTNSDISLSSSSYNTSDSNPAQNIPISATQSVFPQFSQSSSLHEGSNHVEDEQPQMKQELDPSIQVETDTCKFSLLSSLCRFVCMCFCE